MSKKDNVFGKRVMCFGYMQKQKLKHVETSPGDPNYKIDDIIYLSDYNEPVEQYPYKLNTTIVPFTGFIIGKKKIKTTYLYDIFYGPYGGEDITCEKYNEVECYIIAYQMGRKRYVPVDKVRFAVNRYGSDLFIMDDIPLPKYEDKELNEENTRKYLREIAKRINGESNQ